MPVGQKWSDADIQKVRALRAQGLKPRQIAKQTGFSLWAVSKYTGESKGSHPPVYKLPKGESLKDRVLSALAERPVYATPGEILQQIRKPDENIDLHNVVHVIWSLQKRGLVTFREEKGTATASASAVLWDIRLRRPTKIPDTDHRSNGAVKGTRVDQDLPDRPRDSQEAPSQAPLTVPPTPITPFPLLLELWKRKTKIDAAASVLRSAGRQDLAQYIVDQEFTPEQQEMLKYLERTRFSR